MDLCHSDLQAYQELAPDQRDFQLVVEKGIRNAERTWFSPRQPMRRLPAPGPQRSKAGTVYNWSCEFSPASE